jgi:hypothetical protein
MFRTRLGATAATGTEGAFAGSDIVFKIEFRRQKPCISYQTNNRQYVLNLKNAKIAAEMDFTR